MIKVTLDYPPSSNRYWRWTKRGVIVSPVAKEYKETSFYRFREQCGPVDPILGNVSLQVKVYRPRKAGDLDNALKVMIDSLQGLAFENDSQVIEIHAQRFDDKDNPRVEVTVQAA